MIEDYVIDQLNRQMRQSVPVLQDLRREACHNPVVKSGLYLWDNGLMTFEQAMVATVMQLCANNRRLHEDLLSCKRESLSNSVIQPGDKP